MQYSYLIVSAGLSALTMPIILGVAQKRRLFDRTGFRKIHTGNVPRLGGIGMFWSFLLVVLFFNFTDSDLHNNLSTRLPALVPLLGGAAIMHFLGLADDLRSLSYRFKFAVQLVVAIRVVAAGYRFESFVFTPDTFGGNMGLSFLITVGWIVGVTNAVNLIDGIDGLAGGISFIAAAAYSAYYYMEGGVVSSFIALVFAGVVAGFLFINFPAPRAKMFMGDSGSLFLGFSLALLPLLGQSACGASQVGIRLSLTVPHLSVGLLPAFSVLALPIFDTLTAIARRLKAGVSVGTPDRLHIHHRFWDAGYKPVGILAILYGSASIQAVAFLIASRLPSYLAVVIEAISLIFVALLFRFAGSLRPVEKA